MLILTCTLLALGTPPAAANPIPVTPWGDLDLYADPQGMNEVIWDTPPGGLRLVYVVHMGNPLGGATGCQFSAPMPACFTGVYLSDSNIFPVVIGTSQTGAAVGYGACRSYPIHVMTIAFFGYGTTPECCFWWVQPDPNVGDVLAGDCNYGVVSVTGGATIFNPSENGCPTSEESSTWGKVKSLYSE
jgi:hypothetical protein